MYLDVCHQLSDTPIVPVDEDWIIRDLGPHGPTIDIYPIKIFHNLIRHTSHEPRCKKSHEPRCQKATNHVAKRPRTSLSKGHEPATLPKSHEPRCQQTTNHVAKKSRTTLTESHEPRFQQATNHVAKKPRTTLPKSHKPQMRPKWACTGCF